MSVLIKDIIDHLLDPVEKLETTVDELVFGDPNEEVKGIIVSFVASQHVIENALKEGANLIIAHEGTFYSHTANDKILQANQVYLEKYKLINKSGIAIYRFHDHIHRYHPDKITDGLVSSLGWSEYVEEQKPISTILTIPVMTVKEIAEHLKEKLGIPFVRVIGNLSLASSRIGLLVGYRGGGETAIPLFENHNLDVIITGEGPEWETPEYVRDADFQGKKKALIIIGHAASEEPGMESLAKMLASYYPDIPVDFISEKQYQCQLV